jgi:membrane protease YdiL (CAAX protease family)
MFFCKTVNYCHGILMKTILMNLPGAIPAISAFLTKKDHLHEEITTEILYKNRVIKSRFVLMNLLGAFTINIFTFYFYHHKFITLNNVMMLIHLYSAVALLSGFIYLPYHPKYYGFNLNKLSFSLKYGLLIGALCAGVALLVRYNLISGGSSQYTFQFYFIPTMRMIIIYPFIALMQEAVIKGYIQSYIIALYEGGKNSRILANVISSLVFAQLHIAFGLDVVLGTFALSLVTGWMYEHTRSLLGSSIIHYLTGLGLLLCATP